LGLTQEDMAKLVRHRRAPVYRSHISEFENGTPPFQTDQIVSSSPSRNVQSLLASHARAFCFLLADFAPIDTHINAPASLSHLERHLQKGRVGLSVPSPHLLLRIEWVAEILCAIFVSYAGIDTHINACLSRSSSNFCVSLSKLDGRPKKSLDDRKRDNRVSGYRTYDWKGRPLVTTNPSMTSNPADTTTKTASYSGCGCAGGEVVTITDEGTIDGGTAKRRQQKVYSDVLGRTVKTEVLNWEAGSIYSAMVNTYNVRDQVTEIKQYAGPVGSTFQTTSMSYDGYGRLQAKQVPEQTAATTYAYNSDDTLLSDGRGASTIYARNDRHLVTGISYTVPANSGIPVPASVSYSYDAVGNRVEMIDGLGSATYAYNSLSRITSETRNITGASPSSYTISYQYNLAGQLTSITDPNNNTINYARDLIGRTSAITGTAISGVSTYISSMSYRAWGAAKQVNYGNGKTLNATYNDRLKAETFQISGLMSKSYEYYNDGTLKFSSEALDHRFDRLYRWDHVSRIKEALSGAEARGEGATTNRPYKQLFSYDAIGHLTQRSRYRWFLGPDTSSDSYTNNRHDPVGQLWQYDADGNTVSMPGTGYVYDASGRIVTMTSGIPGTATLSWDGDGRKVKSVELSGISRRKRTSPPRAISFIQLCSGGC